MKVKNPRYQEAPILVVGATGQLGGRVVRRLRQRGRPVHAMTRPGANTRGIEGTGATLVHGDLTDARSIDAAVYGCRVVVATANAVAPRDRSTLHSVDRDGYRTLFDACKRHNVQQVVLISVPQTPHDHRVPLFRSKRAQEAMLRDSGVMHTIFRAAPFMDDWFALIGSRLPARGDPAALIDRPWSFLQRFIGFVGDKIETRGLAIVPGSPQTTHDFIAIDDVAEYMVRAIDLPAARNAVVDIAGPERLSWEQVAALYQQVLGRPVRCQPTPAALFRLQQLVMRPFSLAASNIMALNWLAAQGMPVDGDAAARAYGMTLQTAEQFLRAKAALPAR